MMDEAVIEARQVIFDAMYKMIQVNVYAAQQIVNYFTDAGMVSAAFGAKAVLELQEGIMESLREDHPDEWEKSVNNHE